MSDLLVQVNSLKARVAELERKLMGDACDILNGEQYCSIVKLAKPVCDKTGVSLAAIRSNQRNADICIARHILMYMASIHTKLSLPSIGRFLNKDHTTVIHGTERIKRMIRNEPELKALVESLEAELKP